MQAQKNKKIIEAYLAALHSGQPKTREMMDRYISDDDMELKEHIQVFETAFPGYFLEAKEIIAEDNKISVSFIFKGTHKGDFMGVPASNEEVSIPGFISYHMKNGLIVAHDMVVDTMALMQQIGGVSMAA